MASQPQPPPNTPSPDELKALRAISKLFKEEGWPHLKGHLQELWRTVHREAEDLEGAECMKKLGEARAYSRLLRFDETIAEAIEHGERE